MRMQLLQRACCPGPLYACIVEGPSQIYAGTILYVYIHHYMGTLLGGPSRVHICTTQTGFVYCTCWPVCAPMQSPGALILCVSHSCMGTSLQSTARPRYLYMYICICTARFLIIEWGPFIWELYRTLLIWGNCNTAWRKCM